MASPRVIEGENWWEGSSPITKIRYVLPFRATMWTEGLSQSRLNASGSGTISSRIQTSKITSATILQEMAQPAFNLIPQVKGYALGLDVLAGNQSLEQLVAFKTNSRFPGPDEVRIPFSLLHAQIFENNRGGHAFSEKLRNGETIKSNHSFYFTPKMVWKNQIGARLINLQGFGKADGQPLGDSNFPNAEIYRASFTFSGVNNGKISEPPIIE